jgi:hypothetical protein
MNNADLAEIRALLQASAAPERRSSRPPMFGALRSLLAPPAAEPRNRRAHAAPRRVGLTPAEVPEIDPADAQLFDPPVADGSTAEALASEARRRAFGQKQDAAPELLLPLRLSAPLPAATPAEAQPEPGVRRRTLLLTRVASEPAPAETPYLPEDLSDHAEGDAERLYAEAGLFEPRAAADAPAAEADPERELLQHLERVFLVERAALRKPPEQV